MALRPRAVTTTPAALQTAFAMRPSLPSGGVFFSEFEGCDSNELTVELPAGYAGTNPDANIRIALAWAGKLDLFVFDVIDVDTRECVERSESTDLNSQTIYIRAEAARAVCAWMGRRPRRNSVRYGTV